MYRTIEDVKTCLSHAKDREHKCALLIGAGCSVTAGIPTAQQIADQIRKDWSLPSDCVDYRACMQRLGRGDRAKLISDYVGRARINWAHICIAELIKAGYVDRVLTTNFDPLVLRASALLGVYPAVYDLGASAEFDPTRAVSPCIVYLHGQHVGFTQIHTTAQGQQQRPVLKQIVNYEANHRYLLVVGYGGQNDELFADALSQVHEFSHQLHWVGYLDDEPAPHLKTGFLGTDRMSFFIKHYDADSFFITLARELRCFPPALFARPFSHLLESLQPIAPWPIPGEEAKLDVAEDARKRVRRAVREIEQPSAAKKHKTTSDERTASLILEAVMQGDNEKAVALLPHRARLSPDLAEAGAWAYTMLANAISDTALSKQPQEADQMFQAAYDNYAKAVEIKPDMHEALYNWGTALSDQAETKTGQEADELYQAAYDKYAKALEIKPDLHQALYNWGTALSAQADTKTGQEADELFQAACDKYAEAVKIKPDMHEALYNWGTALMEQSRAKKGSEADKLFQAAYAKYAEAVKIKPDMHEALYNWGVALIDQAKTKTGQEADDLFQAACDKYAEAVKIKPDMHEAFSNWGNALSDQAKTKKGSEADRLFQAAYAKYAEAVKIKPDKHEAFNNWGNALSDQARTKKGSEADDLFQAAYEKYAKAVEIKPDMHEALGNWGNALLDQARPRKGDEQLHLFAEARAKFTRAEDTRPGSAAYDLACLCALTSAEPECRSWLKAARRAGTIPTVQHIQEDSDLDSVRHTKWFQRFLASLQDQPSNK